MLLKINFRVLDNCKVLLDLHHSGPYKETTKKLDFRTLVSLSNFVSV